MSLSSIPSGAEIFRVLRSMNLRKAPGPDGMTGLFFESCWSIVSCCYGSTFFSHW